MSDEFPTAPGGSPDDGSSLGDHLEDRVGGPVERHVDRVQEVRERLEAVTELPIEERAAVFAAVNEAIVAELNAMEEV